MGKTEEFLAQASTTQLLEAVRRLEKGRGLPRKARARPSIGTVQRAVGHRARLAARFPGYTCRACGAAEAPARFGVASLAEHLLAAGVCWACDFWRVTLSAVAADPAGYVIAEGRVYRLGYAVGEAGASHVVTWSSGLSAGVGTVIEVGPLPSAWRATTPDTGTIGPFHPAVSELRAELRRELAREQEQPIPDIWRVIDAGKPGAG